MRRSAVLLAAGLAGLVIVASCGARTGLDLPVHEDASVKTHTDATLDARRPHDARMDQLADVPVPQDGHMLDVNDECATPTYCKQDDPNYIYKCGERVFECGSLEQCEVRCANGAAPPEAGTDAAGGDAGSCKAECINPCLDTLGENTSNGCEFYPVEMDTTDETDGVCYAVFIVNQWTTGEPAKLTVDLGGVSMPVDQFARIPSGTGQNIQYNAFNSAQGLPEGEIAILFLSRDPSEITNPNRNPTDPAVLANCPPGVVPAVVGDAALHGTGIGTAFHIRSNVPVVAYQMLPYGGGSARVTGATLLLPTNVWGTNYLATNAYARPVLLVGDGGFDASIDGLERAGPNMVVIAESNDTHVTINPVNPIKSGPMVAGTGASQPVTYTLDQGQYVQFTQLLELSGSPIQSDKPVAVIAGSTLMDIPVTQISRADHGEQMIPPVQALGNQYVGVRYRTRSPPVEESTPWRLIGAVDNTILTFDPPQSGAPPSLSAHQLAEFDATGPFVVSSQDNLHPFYFAQYMTGGEPFSGVGDPEYVNVVAPAQYLSRYTFFTDPTYPETNLVVVRVLDAASGLFPDVTLDCAGKLTGWAPVGSSGTYQFTRIDLSSGNFQGQNGCNNGVHTIKGSFSSEAGIEAGGSTPYFGVTVWGWGNTVTDPLPDTLEAGPYMGENAPTFTRWVSYAYPAGANITKLNSVVVPAQ
jgi:hypothetical protein